MCMGLVEIIGSDETFGRMRIKKKEYGRMRDGKDVCFEPIFDITSRFLDHTECWVLALQYDHDSCECILRLIR